MIVIKIIYLYLSNAATPYKHLYKHFFCKYFIIYVLVCLKGFSTFVYNCMI